MDAGSVLLLGKSFSRLTAVHPGFEGHAVFFHYLDEQVRVVDLLLRHLFGEKLRVLATL